MRSYDKTHYLYWIGPRSMILVICLPNYPGISGNPLTFNNAPGNIRVIRQVCIVSIFPIDRWDIILPLINIRGDHNFIYSGEGWNRQPFPMICDKCTQATISISIQTPQWVYNLWIMNKLWASVAPVRNLCKRRPEKIQGLLRIKIQCHQE